MTQKDKDLSQRFILIIIKHNDHHGLSARVLLLELSDDSKVKDIEQFIKQSCVRVSRSSLKGYQGHLFMILNMAQCVQHGFKILGFLALEVTLV